MIIFKRIENLPNSGLRRLGKPRSENQSKLKERQVLGPYQRTKIDIKHEDDGDTSCN